MQKKFLSQILSAIQENQCLRFVGCPIALDAEASEAAQKKYAQADAYVAKLLASTKDKELKNRIKQDVALGLSLFSPENYELREKLIGKLGIVKDCASRDDSIETQK